MEGVHQPTFLGTLELTDVTKSINTRDRYSGGRLQSSWLGSTFRGLVSSRLVRWHHSPAVVVDCARGEQVIMMVLLIAFMMMIITITNDYNKPAPHTSPRC